MYEILQYIYVYEKKTFACMENVHAVVSLSEDLFAPSEDVVNSMFVFL